ncbi:MAG: hypothetical protein ACFWTN_07735 [Clostridium sp.]|jgi:hypothetical protein
MNGFKDMQKREITQISQKIPPFYPALTIDATIIRVS